ncbi:phage protein [Methylobacterium sp. CCH5-D2]|uniref:phage protein n=1 Tax=Methylobacterium sp. CCH5-D2 TaxID=1768765 RepID=UPI00082B3103|nr:phage protein [Methylobacterium sp. CCH5-D2]
MPAYSFLDFTGTLAGPFGSLDLSAQSAAAAEEGIEIDMTEDKSSMIIGAGGAGQHNLHGTRAGRVTIHLLKVSPVNAKLLQLYKLQTTNTAVYHGRNTLTLGNVASGDFYTCLRGAFVKLPKNSYSKSGPALDWMLDFIVIDPNLGVNGLDQPLI